MQHRGPSHHRVDDRLTVYMLPSWSDVEKRYVRIAKLKEMQFTVSCKLNNDIYKSAYPTGHFESIMSVI